MKITLIVTILVLSSTAFAQSKQPSFDEYPIVKYRGKIHNPKWIKHVKGGEWRDELGKLVSRPEINFAGKYFVAGHSLGTGVRYYSITDLSSGKELDVLNRFATTEPLPKTRDGREFLTVIYTRPHSRLIVAQYLIDNLNNADPECRERLFVFDKGKIKPVTKLSFHCRNID